MRTISAWETARFFFLDRLFSSLSNSIERFSFLKRPKLIFSVIMFIDAAQSVRAYDEINFCLFRQQMKINPMTDLTFTVIQHSNHWNLLLKTFTDSEFFFFLFIFCKIRLILDCFSTDRLVIRSTLFNCVIETRKKTLSLVLKQSLVVLVCLEF